MKSEDLRYKGFHLRSKKANLVHGSDLNIRNRSFTSDPFPDTTPVESRLQMTTRLIDTGILWKTLLACLPHSLCPWRVYSQDLSIEVYTDDTNWGKIRLIIREKRETGIIYPVTIYSDDKTQNFSTFKCSFSSITCIKYMYLNVTYVRLSIFSLIINRGLDNLYISKKIFLATDIKHTFTYIHSNN